MDILRDPAKKSKIRGQLLVMMSLFDLIGSAGYAFTSLPIPEKFGIEGAGGNQVTCTVQGFAIQMGTVAALFNASLAVYYYCMVRLNWTERMIQDLRRWLFICPVVIGLPFACICIPYYGMLF